MGRVILPLFGRRFNATFVKETGLVPFAPLRAEALESVTVVGVSGVYRHFRQTSNRVCGVSCDSALVS